MIRLLHSSDWHLGRFLHGRSLIEDQAFALERLVELIDRVNPHGLLVSGDLFDRPTPPETAVRLLDQFLNQVAGQRNLPIFMIPGNHDSNERVGYASELLRARGVTIFARIEDSLRPVSLSGDDGARAWIYGIPFVEPLIISRALGKEDLNTPDLATGALCRHLLEAKPDRNPAVLLCHAFVVGGETSESEREIFVGGSSHVDSQAFSGFAYTALGHLHKPQKAGRETIRYSGSLLPYSKSEIGHKKSITEVQLKADGSCELKHHHLPQLRDLRYLEGTLNQLIENGAQDPAREDYLIMGLTDSGAVLDAFARLRLVYPHLLHVGRAHLHLPDSLPSIEKAREREEMSEMDLFAEFFRDMTGSDLGEEEFALVASTLEELSVDATS